MHKLKGRRTDYTLETRMRLPTKNYSSTTVMTANQSDLRSIQQHDTNQMEARLQQMITPEEDRIGTVDVPNTTNALRIRKTKIT